MVNGTEFAYPGRADGLEQDAIYEYADNWDFVAGTAKTYNACAMRSRGLLAMKALRQL